MPALNFVWADRDRNIGYQAAVIAPRRPNFSGLVPVPGDGRYEWQRLSARSRNCRMSLNPDKGFYNTSNDYQVPPGYHAYGGRAPRLDRSLSRPGSGGDAGCRAANSPSPTWCSCKTAICPFRRAASCRCCGFADRRAGGRAAANVCCTGIIVLDRDSVEAGIYEMFQRRLMANVQAMIVPHGGAQIWHRRP